MEEALQHELSTISIFLFTLGLVHPNDNTAHDNDFRPVSYKMHYNGVLDYKVFIQ